METSRLGLGLRLGLRFGLGLGLAALISYIHTATSMRRKKVWMELDLTGNIHPDVSNYNQVSRSVSADHARIVFSVIHKQADDTKLVTVSYISGSIIF